MNTLQQKCNDIIRLATDISTYNILNTVNDKSSSLQIGDDEIIRNENKITISIDNDTNTSSYYKKIHIVLDKTYDVGNLFIKIMGDDDCNGKLKWFSVLEQTENYFNLKGEIKMPLNILDIQWNDNINDFQYMISFKDIKWKDEEIPKIMKVDEIEETISDVENYSHDSDYINSDKGSGEDIETTSECETTSDEEDETEEDDDENCENEEDLKNIIIKKDGFHVSLL